MDRYAVMGNPIAHSRSPDIHAAFARQTGERLTYERILVPLDDFAGAVATFEAEGGRGLNITVPFKQQAWALADSRSARAERAGAVNTLVFDADGVHGDNTDGAGLVRDLTVNNNVSLAGRRVLVLGAGGAVRGVLPSLLAEGPAEVVIANRTVERAAGLAEDFGDLGTVAACGFEALAGERFDVVINGTSAGLSGEMPALPNDLLNTGAACYDMAYGREPTVFVRWAETHGAQTALDGLGMLVEQAAESFEIWRGVRPDTRPVIRALRAGATPA